jgi:site-specific DNA recombinase
MTELRRRQQALTAEQQALAAQQLDDEALLQIAHNVDGFVQHLRTSADTLDILQRQKILRLVVKEVVIENRTIRIRHSIPCARAGPLQPLRSPHTTTDYLLRTGRR